MFYNQQMDTVVASCLNISVSWYTVLRNKYKKQFHGNKTTKNNTNWRKLSSAFTQSKTCLTQKYDL